MDYTELQFDTLVRKLIDVSRELGDSSAVCSEVISVLNCITQNQDGKALVDFYSFVDRYVNKGELLIQCAELSAYFDTLHKRIAEYNFFINDCRNKKSCAYEKADYTQNIFTGKGVVYSVIIGDYDAIRAPEYINTDLDYILITDNKSITSSVWDIRYIEKAESMDNTKQARYYKIMCHKILCEYDYSIYIDGKIQICGDIEDYIMRYSTGKPILGLSHYFNTDIYEEAEFCKKIGKGNSLLIDKQIQKYKQDGFPYKYGMTDTCLLVRKHKDKDVERLMEAWWEEIDNWTERDQLSFTYCCWKMGILYDIPSLSVYDNPYIKLYNHTA